MPLAALAAIPLCCPPFMKRAFAPGRVELLGNHTDYNQGVVLSAAIDLGVTVSGEATGRDTMRIASAGFDPVEVALNGGLSRTGAWSDYAVGVVAMLLRGGHAVGGFRAEYSSTLPAGAGLSSSAAIEVATAVLVRDLFGLDLAPMDVARLCRRAENEFVGVNCGLLDQVSSVFGKRGHVLHLDCRSETVDRIPFPSGVDLLIIDSAAPHALTGGEYNERRAQCSEAAQALGVGFLREADSAMLAAGSMPELVRRRAAHIVGENERVESAVVCLRGGDVEGFGRLLSASHRSSIGNFENSTPELDLLVEIALRQSGILGSRLTGGGFGGATVSVVLSEHVDSASHAILEEYFRQTGVRTRAYLCQIGDGAIPDA